MTGTYKLRCSLFGHKSDVRALSCPSDTLVVSTSRDCTAKIWHLSKEGYDACENSTLIGHTGYVTSVASSYSDENPANNLIVTGSYDKIIRGYNFTDTEPIFTLKGHEDSVSALAVEDKIIISGSWDKTVKLWSHEKCINTLFGHEAAVWCVLVVPSLVNSSEDLLIISGAADKFIKLWCIKGIKINPDSSEVTLLKTFIGHTDCVRSLAVVDHERFLSASNDASIRAWHIPTGTCIGEFYGHTNFIYGLDISSSLSIFVSCGEDRSVRVWSLPSCSEWGTNKQFSCFQTIPIPCQSAWCVSLLSNGDIAVGGSDSTIRIFSCDEKRRASTDMLKSYEENLANSKIVVPNATSTGDLDLNNLPGVEALNRTGNSEGQAIVINKGGRFVCYQWSSHDYRWIEVGDVVGTQASNRPVYDGKEYDFVFTVDIAEGMEPLKLPYNCTEDPWFVAYTFIQKHNLPVDYLETVAKYIMQNAGPKVGPDVGLSGPSDPFTGSSRYIPGESSSSPKNDSSSLTPEQAEISFPTQNFLPMKSISLKPLITKLESFNSQSAFPISPELFEMIRSFSFDYTDLQATSLTRSLLEIIPKWPVENIFPFLDLLRCLVLWPNSSCLIFDKINWDYLISISLNSSKLISSNCLLILRLLANTFASDGEKFLQNDNKSELPASIKCIIGLTAKLISLVDDSDQIELTTHKQHQVALSTVLYNMSVFIYMAHSNNSITNLLPQLRYLPGICVRLCMKILSIAVSYGLSGGAKFHPEAITCLLLCLGNCLFSITPKSDNNDVIDINQELKTQRMQLIVSAASSLNLKSDSTKIDNNQTNQEDDYKMGFDTVRKILDYWANSLVVNMKIRVLAKNLISILE